MKIFFIVRNNVGMGNHIQSQAMALSKIGHEVYVLCGKIGKIDRVREECPDIRWIESDSLDIGGFSRHVRQNLIKIRPDLLYVHSSWTIIPVLLARVSKKIPYVYHTDDYLEPGLYKRYKIYKAIEKLFCQTARFVVSNEANRARFMCSEYGLNKMPVVMPVALSEAMAPSEDSFRESINQDRKEVRLVYAGSFGRSRMIHTMIAALGLLNSRYTLTLYGNGWESKEYKSLCESAVNEAGVTDRVFFHDPLPNEELLPELMKYDVGLLLYNDNTLGNFYCQPQKLSEYVACGMPVVAPNYPGMDLLVHKYGIGYVCDPKSPESIAQAISAVTTRCKDEREDQFQHSRTIFFKNLSFENGVEPWIKALSSIKV